MLAAKAGLRAVTVYGESDRKEYIVETLGCGCAFFDFDNDGWLDIFLLSGTRLADAPAGASNRLYKNNRDGTFTDVTERAGLLKTGWACGVCVGDYNNDGFDDLFVTYWGQNVLYRNNGDGTFTDVTRAAGLADSTQTAGARAAPSSITTATAIWICLSPTILISICKRPPSPARTRTAAGWEMPVTCGPRGFPYGQHSLYRNNGDGTFTDVSAASGIAAARNSYGLTAVAADFDDDGWPDIYVACDSTPSLLFLNNHDGTFREEGAIRGVAYGEDGQEQAGMGVAVGDYDLDGRLDIFKTNFEGDTPDLYHNMGKANFDEASRRAGLAVENRFVCWGAGMVDLDNDGLPDLFMVAGHTFPEDRESGIPSFPRRIRGCCFAIWARDDSRSLSNEAGAAIQEPHNSRGCAFGDFDNDGDLDILVINLNEPPSLLRNDVTGNNSWLKVKLVGTKSNRSAIGGAGGRKSRRLDCRLRKCRVSRASCPAMISACTSDWARLRAPR